MFVLVCVVSPPHKVCHKARKGKRKKNNLFFKFYNMMSSTLSWLIIRDLISNSWLSHTLIRTQRWSYSRHLVDNRHHYIQEQKRKKKYDTLVPLRAAYIQITLFLQRTKHDGTVQECWCESFGHPNCRREWRGTGGRPEKIPSGFTFSRESLRAAQEAGFTGGTVKLRVLQIHEKVRKETVFFIIL